MAKTWIVKTKTSITTMDGKMTDVRQNRWNSRAEALAGIVGDQRQLGLRVPVLEGGRTVLYWWEVDLTDNGFVLYLGDYAKQEYVDQRELFLQNQIDTLAAGAANVIHTTGDETKDGRLTLTTSPTIPAGTADTDAVNVLQILQLPTDIRFQKIMRDIPHIRVTTTAYNKVKEFIQVVAANNYCHIRMSVVNQNSTVKDFEFMAGYDALSTSAWSKLTPLQVYSDRGQDFDIEIKKVTGFGPTNFGILFRFRNLTPGQSSECSINMSMAYQLPAVGVNYDQFNFLYTPEYDWDGNNGLYWRKLTLTSDGRNWRDDLNQLFVKDGSQLILDLQNYKADLTYVNSAIQLLQEDIAYIEETLLPLKQDKSAANATYEELLQRDVFLQQQIDAIPDQIDLTAAMVARLPIGDTLEQLDLIALGEPYRTTDGRILYRVADTDTFEDTFDYPFGGNDEETSPTVYSGIFSETFDLPFEL